MEGKTIRSAKEIKDDWESIAYLARTVRDEGAVAVAARTEDKDLAYLQLQAQLQMETEVMDLAPVSREDIEKILSVILHPSLPRPELPLLPYGEILDELIESGRAGKFTETLIASIPSSGARDGVALLFVDKLVGRKMFGRARTAIPALAFNNRLSRFHAAMHLAEASDDNDDLALLRSLVAPLPEEEGTRVIALLLVFLRTKFYGDFSMARASAANAEPYNKAYGSLIIAVLTMQIDDMALAWRAIQELPHGSLKTRMVFTALSVIARWSIGGLGLPKLPENLARQMLETIPVKSWRDNVSKKITEAAERKG